MRLLLAVLAVTALMVPDDVFAQRRQDGERNRQREGRRDGERDGRRGFGERGGRFGGGFANPVMQALDVDRDGELSAAEIAAAAANLKKLDKNNDGKIDREEQRPDFVGSRIEQLDANKDKKLSKEEVADDRRLSENFAEIDTNKDGSLDEAEVRKYYTDLFGSFRNRGRDGDRGDRGDGERRPRRRGGDNNRQQNNDVEL